MKAYKGGAKGCTTFRASGKLGGILVSKDAETFAEEPENLACTIDPVTGERSCE